MKSIDAFVKEQKNSPPKFKTIDNFVRDKFVEKKTTEYKAATANKNQFYDDNITNAPIIQHNNNTPDVIPTWNGPLDNPIGRTVKKAAGKGLDYGIVKPLDSIYTAAADTLGAAHNLIGGSHKGLDGSIIRPAETHNLGSDLKDIWTNNKTSDHSALEGALPNDFTQKYRLYGSDKTLGDIEDAALQLSAPLPVGKLVSGIKGIKTASTAVGEAFERFAARNKEIPINFEQYQQAAKSRNELSLGQIDRGEQGIVDKFNFINKQMGKEAPLQLNPSRAEVRQNAAQARSTLSPGTKPIRVPGETVIPQLNASPEYNLIQRIKEKQTLNLPEARPSTIAEINRRNGNVLPTNTNPIYGQGSVADPLALPQGNYIKPTKLKISGVNETLDHVITKIRPEVIELIEAPVRRDLLVKYVQKNTGFPVQEIHNMPMKDIQRRTNKS